jgi:hypothetical protein
MPRDENGKLSYDYFGISVRVMDIDTENEKTLWPCLECGALTLHRGMRIHINWHKKIEGQHGL